MHYANEWPLLVVCPTSMSLTWCEELERWCPFLAPGDVNLVRSHHNAELRRARVTVLTYGLVTNGKERDRLLQNIASAGFKVVIADEAHYLKSKDAQRSKLLLPVLAAARRCVVLTGTPALNESQSPIPIPNPSRPRRPKRSRPLQHEQPPYGGLIEHWRGHWSCPRAYPCWA